MTRVSLPEHVLLAPSANFCVFLYGRGHKIKNLYVFLTEYQIYTAIAYLFFLNAHKLKRTSENELLSTSVSFLGATVRTSSLRSAVCAREGGPFAQAPAVPPGRWPQAHRRREGHEGELVVEARGNGKHAFTR